MTTTRVPRATTRRLAGLAAASLLTAGLACAGMGPAEAARSNPLGFYVNDLAATPDGAVVAVGYSSDEATGTGTAHAALAHGSEVVEVDVPGASSLTTVAILRGTDVAVLAGTNDQGASAWTVDLSAQALSAQPLDAPPAWSTITATLPGQTVRLAGTTYDAESNEIAVAQMIPGQTTVLAEQAYPTAAATDAAGTGYVIGTGADGETGELWVLDGSGALTATHPVGAYPSDVAASEGVAYVADTAAEGEEIVAVDAATGAELGAADFGDRHVSDLAMSADGATLYVAAGYSLYAIATDALADFDVDNAEAIESDGWLQGLAIAEQGDSTQLFSSLDGDTVGSFGPPAKPEVTALVDPDVPNTLDFSVPGDVQGLHAKLTSEGGATVFDGTLETQGDGRQCSYDYEEDRSSCWIDGLDADTTYHLVVTATNFLGSTDSDTQTVATLPLLDGPSTASFTGTGRVGQTLTAVTSTGWPAGTQLTYGWAINGGQWGDFEAGTTLRLTPDLAGTHVSLVVTGTKDGYAKREVRSAAVLVQAAPNVQLPPLPVTSKAVAKVAGTAKVGKTLTAKVGTWPAGTRIKVQWRANGKVIKGATKKKLKLTKKLKGKKISVVVTGTKPGYASKVKKSKAIRVK